MSNDVRWSPPPGENFDHFLFISWAEEGKGHTERQKKSHRSNERPVRVVDLGGPPFFSFISKSMATCVVSRFISLSRSLCSFLLPHPPSYTTTTRCSSSYHARKKLSRCNDVIFSTFVVVWKQMVHKHAIVLRAPLEGNEVYRIEGYITVWLGTERQLRSTMAVEWMKRGHLVTREWRGDKGMRRRHTCLQQQPLKHWNYFTFGYLGREMWPEKVENKLVIGLLHIEPFFFCQTIRIRMLSIYLSLDPCRKGLLTDEGQFPSTASPPRLPATGAATVVPHLK